MSSAPFSWLTSILSSSGAVYYSLQCIRCRPQPLRTPTTDQIIAKSNKCTNEPYVTLSVCALLLSLRDLCLIGHTTRPFVNQPQTGSATKFFRSFVTSDAACKNLVKVSMYAFSSVCRWRSNVCPCKLSRYYHLHQESYEGGGKTFWPTLVHLW